MNCATKLRQKPKGYSVDNILSAYAFLKNKSTCF